MIQVIDILVIMGIITEINWSGFWVGSITSLVMLFHSPIFRKIAPKKYISMFFISMTAWTAIMYYFFYPEDNKCYKVELYKFHLCILNVWEEKNKRPSRQLLYFFAVGILSCNTMWRLRVGELGKEFFPTTVENVKSNHPKTEFSKFEKDKSRRLEKSYYINYFVKKISLVMKIRWEKGMTESDRLANRYLENIPYLDDKKLAEKYHIYSEFKNV